MAQASSSYALWSNQTQGASANVCHTVPMPSEKDKLTTRTRGMSKLASVCSQWEANSTGRRAASRPGILRSQISPENLNHVCCKATEGCNNVIAPRVGSGAAARCTMQQQQPKMTALEMIAGAAAAKMRLQGGAPPSRGSAVNTPQPGQQSSLVSAGSKLMRRNSMPTL